MLEKFDGCIRNLKRNNSEFHHHPGVVCFQFGKDNGKETKSVPETRMVEIDLFATIFFVSFQSTYCF